MFSLASSILVLLPAVAASTQTSPDLLEERTLYSGQETQLTFFGYPDNCDSTGCYRNATKYDCQGRNSIAGGDGTFSNPLSVAIKEGGVFQPCQIGYTTYLQKFVIFDGGCASCETNHMDIWVQSSCSDDASSVCACEDQLTPPADEYVYYGITADDPSVFNVDTTALFNGGCTGHTYQVTHGMREIVGTKQSVNPKVKRTGMGGVGDMFERKKRQSACSENTCSCPC